MREIIEEAGGVDAFLERQTAAKPPSTSDLLFKTAALLKLGMHAPCDERERILAILKAEGWVE